MQVIVGPNQSGTNTGTLVDPGGDEVSLSASTGSVSENNGVWSWELPYEASLVSGTDVTIAATDDDGATSLITFSMEVDADAPVLTHGTDSVQVDEGSIAITTGSYADANMVALTASVGTVEDQGDGTWSWSYEETADGDASPVPVTITAVDEADNQTTIAFDVIVNNVAPTASLSLDQTTIEEGSTVTLQIRDLVDPGLDFANQYIIDWGDGNTEQVTIPSPQISADVSRSHVYGDGPANHAVTVSIVDEDGTHTLSDSLNVNVLNERPSIGTFNVPSSTLGDELLSLIASATDAAGVNDVLSYLWTITSPSGLITQLVEANASYTPSSLHPGTHTVSLSVADDEEGVTTVTSEIEVQGAPIVDAGGGLRCGTRD